MQINFDNKSIKNDKIYVYRSHIGIEPLSINRLSRMVKRTMENMELNSTDGNKSIITIHSIHFYKV